MMDRSLNMFLVVLFGLSGTAVLVLAWLLPMSGTDKITASVTGLIGLAVAIIQLRRWKSNPAPEDTPVIPVEVELENDGQ